MNRIDRVTAILIQLQSRRVVKAQEIADRFKISLRTVYRDIKTLDEAGIPILGEAGVGYSIMEGYRLPPVMFTKEEATAFLLAEKIVEKYTDPDNSEKYRSALYKIKSVLRTADKEYLSEIENRFSVLKDSHLPHSIAINHSLQSILQAIHEKKIIDIVYLNAYAQAPTKRSIEPVGTYLQNNYWYLIAFCRLKDDYRNFRVDRITDFKLSKDTFKREHLTLQAYIEQISNEVHLQKVVIQVSKNIAKYINTQKYYYGFVSEVEQEDSIEMTFLCTSIEYFVRWYLNIAPESVIIKPIEMKERIKSLIAAIAEKL